MDYVRLAAKAAVNIAKFGIPWTVVRGSTLLGTVHGVRTQTEVTAKQTGMVLAADRNVSVLLAATIAVKPGDKITAGNTLTVVAVEPIQPGAVVLAYKVTAS